MKNKKGITLIVLIITVIVVIILAAVIIISISNNNPISSAKEATFKSDVRSFQEELNAFVSNEMIKDYSGTREKLIMTEIPTLEEMKKYVEDYSQKYAFKDGDTYRSKLGIEEDELVYYADKVTEDEKKWLDELGIKPSGYYIQVASEDCFTWDENTHTKITGYIPDLLEAYLKNTNGVLKIPDKCTDIGSYAFMDCSKFKGIIIGNKVTNIEVGAFVRCSNLEKVVLPDSIITINKSTFNSCYKLTEIVMPQKVSGIADQAFMNCYALKNVALSNITYLGEEAFSSCRSLEKVELDNIYQFNPGVFSGCSALKDVKLPNNLKELPSSTFLNCTSLTNIDFLPKTITSIKSSTFSGCKDLTSITIPTNVTKIGDNAFNDCSNLIDVTLPNGIENIGAGSFEYCENLKKINIPDTVIDIGRYAFFGDKGLESVFIPNSVQTMDDSIFAEGNANLKIYCESNSMPITWNSTWSAGININNIFWGCTEN